MPFFSMPNEIIGEVDADGSPTVVIEVVVAGQLCGRLCHIDTGCHDQVIVTDYDFAMQTLGLSFSLAPNAPHDHRFLANGQSVSFLLAVATIDWFGQRSITVLTPDPRLPPGTPVPPLVPNAPAPLILIGSALLAGSTLAIDYSSAHGTVRITAPSPAASSP